MSLSAQLAPVLAQIPSPSESVIQLGPLRLTAYGLMIAFGVIAGYELARRRWRARGGDPDDMGAIAIWAIPAGLIGARLYHVATDWNRLYADNPAGAIRIWEGGLGIPGGLAVGVVVGIIVARKRGMNIPVGLDVIAPALPLAQAIGRLGNWWNQELYGRPTDLPWGLRIDEHHREAGYEAFETFQPTFLYEGLWNLALVGILILIDRRRVLRPGRIFAVYVGGYALGRLWIEALRIDTATEIMGIRVNIWMSVLVFGAAALFLVIGGIRRRPDDSDEPYIDGHRFVDPELVEGDDGDDGSGSAKGRARAKDAEDEDAAGEALADGEA